MYTGKTFNPLLSPVIRAHVYVATNRSPKVQAEIISATYTSKERVNFVNYDWDSADSGQWTSSRFTNHYHKNRGQLQDEL